MVEPKQGRFATASNFFTDEDTKTDDHGRLANKSMFDVDWFTPVRLNT